MKKLPLYLFLVIGFYSLIGNAQVGIGNVDPKAFLDVTAEENGIPVFRIEPQENPVGTHNGQMAVVDNMLYLYDEERQKWLSAESHALQFGRSGSVGGGEFLRFGGDVIHEDSGAPMPRKGTIVAISAINPHLNNVKTYLQLWIDGSTVPANSIQNLSGRFNVSSRMFFLNTYNLDFDAENVFMISADTGGVVGGSTVILWIKWRL